MSEHQGLADAADAELVARAVDDLTALEVLYRRYVRRVAAFAARRCSTADDVAQTFDRLLRSAHRYGPDRGTVASFVFAIAESEIADQRRRAARHEALVTRLKGRDLLDADDIARAEAAIDAAEVVATLEPALDALPHAENEVLRLVADGLSPSEAAARLEITPNAARVRLARARRRVRHHADTTDTTDTTTPSEPPWRPLTLRTTDRRAGHAPLRGAALDADPGAPRGRHVGTAPGHASPVPPALPAPTVVHRRAVRRSLAAAALAVIAAAATLSTVGGNGGGGGGTTAGRHADTIETPAEGEIETRTIAAIDQALADSIVHTVDDFADTDIGDTEAWYDEGSGTERRVTRRPDGTPSYEVGPAVAPAPDDERPPP